MKGEFTDLQIYSITGQPIPYTLSGTEDESLIRLVNPSPGIYILQYRYKGKPLNNKIIVSQ